jgi:hypothetical protein
VILPNAGGTDGGTDPGKNLNYVFIYVCENGNYNRGKISPREWRRTEVGAMAPSNRPKSSTRRHHQEGEEEFMIITPKK